MFRVAATDEVQEAGLFPPHHVGNVPVLVECHPLQGRRVLHLRM